MRNNKVSVKGEVLGGWVLGVVWGVGGRVMGVGCWGVRCLVTGIEGLGLGAKI